MPRPQSSILATIAALLLLTPAVAHSQALTAVWDPSPPQDNVTSYEVCVGTTSLSCNLQRATVGSGETSFVFTPNAGVLYRVAVRSVNVNGAGAYSPEVSVSIPSLTQPANQTSTANVAITALTLAASDPDGGTLRFTHTGLPIGLSLNQNSGVVTGTPTAAGTYNVTIFVADDLETTSKTFTWTVQPPAAPDTTGPTLAITSHTPGQTMSSSTTSITLSGTATDSGTGNRGITSVTVNGSAASNGTASTSGTANWNRSVSLSSGANTFTVVATDGAGNTTTSSITINRSAPETTPPTLTITSHTTGQTVTLSSSITLAGTATDSGTGGSGISSVTVNGSAAQNGTASTNATANWNRTLTLSTGANTLTVVARDGAGNNQTVSIIVNYTPDTAAPTLAITSHTTGQLVGSSSVTLTGTATDSGSGGNGITSVTVNGSSTNSTASGNGTANWSRNLTLSNGSNVVTVVARDGAGNTRTTPITLIVPTPMTSVNVSGNMSSPRVTGTTVTFTAGGSGGTAPYSFKWLVQKDGGAWTVMQAWSTTNTFAWTPTQAGTYMVGAWGRSSGATADAAQAAGNVTFVINAPAPAPAPPAPAPPAPAPPAPAPPAPAPPAPAPPAPSSPMSGASVNANLTSPRPAGTPVTFIANGAGGTAPYSFKWWVQKDGGVWNVVQDWSTSSTYSWTPSQTGTYVIGAWGRSSGATADAAQAVGVATFVISGSASPAPAPPAPAPPTPGNPMSFVSVSSNLSSPRTTGTPVTFTANGSGGSAPYSFKWWVQKDGGAWSMVQDWNTGSFNWTPSQTGTYVIGAWGRSSGSTADAAQAVGVSTFVISSSASPAPAPPAPTPPPPSGGAMTSASLTSNRTSVEPLGTPFTFTPSGTGGTAPYSFKWWVQKDGGPWTLVRTWGTGNFTYTPSQPGTYVIGAWGRSSGATADVAQAIATITVRVTP